MNRFAPALRRVAAELDLPAGERAPILLEMAADLETVYAHHRARGCDEAEAVRRAEEAVLGSSEVVRRLAQLHRRRWRSWSESVGNRLSRGTGLALLLLALVPILLVVGAVAARVLAGSGNIFTVLLIGVGLTIAGLATTEARRFRRGRPERALPTLLLLSGTAPVLGLLASVLGLYTLSMELAGGAATAHTQAALAARLAHDAAVLATGLLLGLAGAFAWFVLVGRASARAAREIEALLEAGPAVRPPAETDGPIPLTRRRRA
jgi:hypothetical protein